MTNFEKITASQEALGAFLASLSVAKWMLNKIEVSSTQTVSLELMKINSTGRYNDRMQIPQAYFHDMVKREYGKTTRVYDDYKAAMAEVKRLNAEEREKLENA